MSVTPRIRFINLLYDYQLKVVHLTPLKRKSKKKKKNTVVYFAKFIEFSSVSYAKKPFFTLVNNVSSIRNGNQ